MSRQTGGAIPVIQKRGLEFRPMCPEKGASAGENGQGHVSLGESKEPLSPACLLICRDQYEKAPAGAGAGCHQHNRAKRIRNPEKDAIANQIATAGVKIESLFGLFISFQSPFQLNFIIICLFCQGAAPMLSESSRARRRFYMYMCAPRPLWA